MVWSNESRQSRGYGRAWEILRARVIKRDKGLCQACLAKGWVTVGREVDHRVSKAEAAKRGWTKAQVDSVDNLQLLCKPCHDHKTATENGRTYHPRVQVGEDGWPLDNGGGLG